MSAQASASFDLTSAVAIYMNATDAQMRKDLFSTLSPEQKKAVREEAKRIQAAGEPAPQMPTSVEFEAPESDDDIPLMTPGTTVIAASTTGKQAVTAPKQISEEDIQQMWAAIETFDISQIDAESIRVFEYEGFNPDEILRTMMQQKAVNNISNPNFLRDIAVLCGLAVVKGTVNDNNYKKMKKPGQEAFNKLSAMYGIKMGSAKGMPSDVVTVARVAAAFPGTILNLLHNNKVASRVFAGPMKSQRLPGVVRHQALAACIPRGTPEVLKEFLLAGVVAFSVDQSIVISARKTTAQQAVETQRNFIRVAHEGRYPREEIRGAIFRLYDWNAAYPAISDCVRELKKLDESYVVPDITTFKAELTKMGI